MRNIFKGIIISALCGTALCTNVYADKLSNSGPAANPITGHMNIVGEVDGKEAARVATIFILQPNTVLDNTENGIDNNCLYVNSADVDFDGGYEFEFDFNPILSQDSKLPVYIVCGENIYNYTYTYKTWDEIKELFNSIRNKNVVYTQLEEFFDTLGTDFSEYQHTSYQAELVENINSLSGVTDDENGIALIKDCIKNTKEELGLLKDLPNQSNWAEVKSKISEIATYSGLEFLYKNSNSEKVCKELMSLMQNGKVFYSAKELQTEFDNLVKKYPQNSTTQIGGGGGGGGGSSSGGGSSTSVILPITPSAEKPSTGNSDLKFDDLPKSHWAYDAVEYLCKEGYAKGVSERSYEPERNITREEFVKLAVCAFGIYNEDLKADFEDTDANEWYSPYIASAKKDGLVKGISDTTFGVGQYIKRQDMAVILYNGLKKHGYQFSGEQVQFDDDESVEDYAKTAVSALAAEKIINGMGNGCFSPNENATRAQAAQMIYALLGRNNV